MGGEVASLEIVDVTAGVTEGVKEVPDDDSISSTFCL